MSHCHHAENYITNHTDSSLICVSCFNHQLAADKYTQNRKNHENQIRRELEIIHQSKQQAEIERQNILQLQQKIIQTNKKVDSEINILRQRKEDEFSSVPSEPNIPLDLYSLEVKAYRESLLQQMTEKERLKGQEKLQTLNSERERMRKLQEDHKEEVKSMHQVVDYKRKQLRNDLLRQMKEKTVEKERELYQKSIERLMLEAKVEHYELEKQRVLIEARLKATEYCRHENREPRTRTQTPVQDITQYLKRQESVWLCGKCSRPTDMRYLSRY